MGAYENLDLGIRSVINRTSAGRYAVALIDLDADKWLPTVRLFNDEDAARDYAKSLVADRETRS